MTPQLSRGVINILKKVYPIGSIYISVSSTNPGTLFGFGTWSAFAAGKTLVGLNSSETEFDTVEETGGEKTHQLSTAELATHTHTQDAHGHYLEYAPNGNNITLNGGGTKYNLSYGTSGTNTPELAARSVTATNQNTGSGTAHNNLQPYIVTYMWKRTA